MPVDIFQSRRTYYDLCKWWTRDESDKYNSNELIMKRAPDGVFYAKEVSGQVESQNIVGGLFMFDSTSVTLKTPDDITGIKKNSIVEYQGEMWVVDSIQKQRGKKQNSMFMGGNDISHYWYLQLRK